MVSRGRPKKTPILPERIDPDNQKKNIKGQLYPEEWKILKEKLEERGYSSIAEWIEEKAEEVVLDQDLKERKEELEKKIESKKTDIEGLKKELEDIEDKLGNREEVKEKVRRDIKEYILSDNIQTGDSPNISKLDSELDDIVDKFEISFKNREKAGKIYLKAKGDLYNGKFKEEDLPDRILDRWEEENIVTLGVVD